MKTVKSYILQWRDTPWSGEWIDAGVAGDTLDYVKSMLEGFARCSPDTEFRIIEQTVITIRKPVKL